VAVPSRQEHDITLQWALEDLVELAKQGGLATSEVTALLQIMSVYEVLDYLDHKLSNRLQ
jgi:hypothetical protein